MKTGEAFVKKYDLSTIRILASVGEPLNPEAYMWYRKNIGADQAPIIDTWWQTETGCHVIAPSGHDTREARIRMLPVARIQH